MIQLAFFALLIVTLIAGTFSYFPQLQQPIHPLKYMLDSSGIAQEDTVNTDKTEQINLVTTNGLLNIHKKMDNVATQQKKMMDSIDGQMELLKASNKDANAILLQALQKGSNGGNQDVLQLKVLASSLNDEDRLLVSRGEDIVSLSDQINADRSQIAEQMNLANINTASSFGTMQRRYNSLQTQAQNLFCKVDQYNNDVNQHIANLPGIVGGYVSNSTYANYEQLRIQRLRTAELLQNEKDNMQRIEEIEKEDKQKMQDARETQAFARERMKDSLQHTEDMIQEQHQRQNDQMMWATQK